MARSVDLRNAIDATVKQAQPGSNFNASSILYTWDGGFGYLYFSLPFPRGATILSATLYAYANEAWSGTKTLTAKRLNQAWAANTITWNNRPVAGADVGSATRSGIGQGTEFAMDVTTYMQAVANGDTYNGFRLEATNANEKGVKSTRVGSIAWQPRLHVVWAEKPFPPTDLNPRGSQVVGVSKPHFTWQFVDSEGTSTMYGYRLQIDPAANWGSPAFDYTGVWPYPSSDPGTVGWAGLSSGGSTWWRVATQDTDGLWSDWSSAVQFTYKPLGSVAITYPSGGLIDDPTPDIAWTFSGTGLAQTMYQILLYDITTVHIVGGGGGIMDGILPDADINQETLVYDSGRIASSVGAHAIPGTVIAADDHTYKVVVRVWDDQNRVATGGLPIYVEDDATFTWDRSNTVDPVTALHTQADFPAQPYVHLAWSHTGTVSYFSVWRNGQRIGTVDGAASMEYIDWFVPGRQTHTYTVMVHAAGLVSEANPEIEVVSSYRHPWVVSATNPNMLIPLANANVDPGVFETNDIATPLIGNPVLVQQSIKGYVGTCEAEIADHVSPLVTAAQGKEALLYIRQNPRCYFMWADQAIECYIHSIKYVPIPRADGGTDYGVTFGFVQTRGTV